MRLRFSHETAPAMKTGRHRVFSPMTVLNTFTELQIQPITIKADNLAVYVLLAGAEPTRN